MVRIDSIDCDGGLPRAFTWVALARSSRGVQELRRGKGRDAARGENHRPGFFHSGTGLRALAILVARAVNDLPGILVARPALVEASVKRYARRGHLHRIALRAAPPARSVDGRVRPPPRPAVQQPGTDGAGDGADGPVQEEHVETWRLVTLAQQGDGGHSASCTTATSTRSTASSTTA